MKSIFYRTLASLLFLTVVLSPFKRVDAKPGHFSPNQTALEFIQKVNDLRTSKGLQPYSTEPVLMTIAQNHATYISSTGVLTHFDDKGKRPYQRAIDAGYSVAGDLSLGGLFAESIYSGSGISDEDVIAAWQANATDSLALLSADFEDVGVGIVAAGGKTYYVINAGSARSDDASSGGTVAASPTVGAGTGTAPAGTGIPNTPLASGEIYHVVQKNEALWSIALLYGTTIAELKFLNGLATDEIFEGQRLLIHAASTETPMPSPVPVTATLGIPTSTPTQPVTPTATLTPTPLPTPPTSMKSGGAIVGGITLVALIAAGLVAFLGKKRDEVSKQ
jgi:uncharacterized protein YkwD